MHEQGTGVRGEEAGDGEGDERRASRVHPVRLGGALVLAHGDDDAARAAAAETADDGEGQGQPGQGDEVEADLAADGNRPEQRLALDARPRQPAEVAAIEEVGRGRQGQGQRGDRQQQAAGAQGGQADSGTRHRPGGRGDEHRQGEIPPLAGRQRAGNGGADADERQLAEADVAGPSGEHHEREGDDAEHDDRRGEVHAALGRDEREHECRGGNDECQRAPRPKHLGQAGQGARDRPHRTRRHPAGVLDQLPDRGPAPAEQEEGGDDDGEQYGVDVRRLTGVEDDGLLEHSEGDRAGRHHREVVHTPEHGRPQRPQQDPRSEDGADLEAHHAGPQEDGQRREHGGDRPHRGVHASHGNAERRRPVRIVGGGAQRHAEARPAQEGGEGDEHDRNGDHGDDVVAVEADVGDRERRVYRRGVRLHAPLEVERVRQQEAGAGQQLGHADRRHRQHEARRAGETPDDEELEHGPQHEGGAQAGRHPDEPVDAGAHDEQDGQRGRHRAQVALGEVHDAVRLVDEDEPEGDERGQPADHGAVDDDAERHRPQHLLGGDQHGHRRERDGAPAGAGGGRGGGYGLQFCGSPARGRDHPPPARRFGRFGEEWADAAANSEGDAVPPPHGGGVSRRGRPPADRRLRLGPGRGPLRGAAARVGNGGDL